MILTVLLTLVVTTGLVQATESEKQFLSAIKTEIFAIEKQCTHLTIFLSGSLEQLSVFPVTPTDSASKDDTYLTADILNNETSLAGLEHPRRHHHVPCFLILLEVTHQASNISLDAWPLGFLSTSPAYNLFFFDMLQGEETGVGLEDFANITRKLLHAYFVSGGLDGTFQVFHKDHINDEIQLLSTYPESRDTLGLLPSIPNFRGQPIVATVCAICDRSLAEFRETGMWTDYMAATMYELSEAVNGTLEMTAVFGAPKSGKTADGEWDEFVAPTLDGSAALVELLQPTEENSRVILTTKTFYFDSVTFITDKPKVASLSSMGKVVYPLKTTVWIALLETAFCLFVALETIIEIRRVATFERQMESLGLVQQGLSVIEKSLIWDSIHPHSYGWTLFAIITSALDQSALSFRAFAKNVEAMSVCRFLVALWYILVIVVGCGYKSVLTSMMVTPTYAWPPTTFQELVDSDYTIGAVFYSSALEHNFASFNNAMSREIQRRVREYDFLDPDCYFNVLTSRAACIVTTGSVIGLSAKYTTDIHGKPLFIFAREKLFPVMLSYGISMHFAALLEPLDEIIGWLHCTGVYELWKINDRRQSAKVGEQYARQVVHKDPLYTGEIVHTVDESWGQISLYLEILGIGYGVAVATLVSEWVGHFRRRHRSNELIVSEEYARLKFKTLQI